MAPTYDQACYDTWTHNILSSLDKEGRLPGTCRAWDGSVSMCVVPSSFDEIVGLGGCREDHFSARRDEPARDAGSRRGPGERCQVRQATRTCLACQSEARTGKQTSRHGSHTTAGKRRAGEPRWRSGRFGATMRRKSVRALAVEAPHHGKLSAEPIRLAGTSSARGHLAEAPWLSLVPLKLNPRRVAIRDQGRMRERPSAVNSIATRRV